LRYKLPRLRRGISEAMSQQGAGIGSRGPGETKLEVDRRRIQDKIAKLSRDLVDLANNRREQAKGRSRSGLGAVAIVGYTNAGKSTLLNHLTDAGVLVENRLFATLDPTTRRLALPGGEPVLVSDTVGFVRRLPHGLVESFKSTLEVAVLGDLLIHVVDSTAVDPAGQILAVREVLTDIGAGDVPELLVFNKADMAPDVAEQMVASHPGSVAISAVTGTGIDDLLRTIGDRMRAISVVVELLIPYDRGDIVASVHREGEVVSTANEENGMRIRARLGDASTGRLSQFVVDQSVDQSDGRTVVAS